MAMRLFDAIFDADLYGSWTPAPYNWRRLDRSDQEAAMALFRRLMILPLVVAALLSPLEVPTRACDRMRPLDLALTAMSALTVAPPMPGRARGTPGSDSQRSEPRIPGRCSK